MPQSSTGRSGAWHGALYRGKAAGPAGHEFEPSSHAESPRLIGARLYVVMLCTLQIAVTAVLAATLLDLVIAGSMREALRYMIVDAPLWQFPVTLAALALFCFAVRFSAEANIELVLPDLFDMPGNTGLLARLLPRALALLAGLSVGYPLLRLACDQLMRGLNVLGGAGLGYRALFFGLAAIAIGAYMAARAALHNKNAGFRTESSSFALRAFMALIPLTAAATLAGTLLWVFPVDTPDQFPGIAHDAIARYSDSDISRAAGHILAEGLGLYLCAVFARAGLAVVISLLMPGATGSEGMRGRAAALVPRCAAAAVGLAAAGELVGEYAGTALSRADLQWLCAIAFGYVLIGLLASLTDWPQPHAGDKTTIFQRYGGRWLYAADRMAGFDAGWRRLFIALTVIGLAIFFFLVDLRQVERAQTLGPVTILLLWGFTATVLFAPLAYLSQMTRMPLLLILLVSGMAFAGFDLNDNHQIRDASTYREARPGPVPPPGRYREHLELGKWLASRSDWRVYDRYPVFLVATEGGGLRAAYFTASVLAALEQKCPGFAQHVIAVSSVSGGSVGAAVFAGQSAEMASAPAEPGCNAAPLKPGPRLIQARKVLAADLLSPLLGAMLFPDALQRILPLPLGSFDRARALEYALEAGWRRAAAGCRDCDPERMSKPVADLFAGPQKPVPHLFLNTTEAGTGRTVPFATWDIGDLAVPDRTVAERERQALPHAILVPLQNLMRRDQVRLSTAAMLSARFPYLTPAAKLGNAGHYVDGGYFENSGTWLLSGIAQNLIGQQLDYRNDDKDLEQAVRNAVIIPIVIRSQPCTRRSENDGCDEDIYKGDADNTWNEMLSPPRALLATRDKRAEYSINDLGAVTALVQRLTGAAALSPAAAGGMECNEFLCSVTIRFYNAPNAEVPLTWMLSSRARLSMDNAVNRILAENLAAPAGPDVNQGDRIEGSYRQILCLMQESRTRPVCP